MPNMQISWFMPVASSMKSRSLRCKFSISEMRLAFSMSTSMSMHGTSLNPASFAARSRLSPATSSYFPPRDRTVSGFSIP